jgi:hypothetical protein
VLAGGVGVALTTASAVAVNSNAAIQAENRRRGFRITYVTRIYSVHCNLARLERPLRTIKYARRRSRIILHPSLMRPLAVLLGIVMGSAVSIAAGLILTWVVFLFLSDSAARFAPERLPLARGVAVFTLISAASAASFYGELRIQRWRFASHLAVVALLGLAVWLYWP